MTLVGVVLVVGVVRVDACAGRAWLRVRDNDFDPLVVKSAVIILRVLVPLSLLQNEAQTRTISPSLKTSSKKHLPQLGSATMFDSLTEPVT